MSRTVAIACQGGGSHTAFTAGVLRTLLTEDDSQIAALSGTSGGAVCAYLTWSALLDGGERARATAADRLEQYWNGVKAEPPYETLLDSLTMDTLRAWGRIGVVLETSPYLSPFATTGKNHFLTLLEKAAPAPPAPYPESGPRLLVSAADVNSGEFRVFHSHANGNAPPDVITREVILASAAVPTLFRAQQVDGHRYWDGLFALNPPVRDLPDAGRAHSNGDEPLDEIWAILINPLRYRGEPTRMDTIRDRRNELAANISFQQEITFIGKINELVLERQLVEDPKKKRYSPIKIRVITMADEVADTLDYESKLSRNPNAIDYLVEHGQHQATEFLRDLKHPDADDRTALPAHDIWGRTKDWNWKPLPEPERNNGQVAPARLELHQADR
jgi:NTE family protein